MGSEERQAEQHERKRGAVVEPGLAGQCQAHPIAIVGMRYLHLGRQHRICRRHDRGDQQREVQRHLQHHHRETGDQHDREGNADAGETNRSLPPGLVQRHAKLQSRAEQGKKKRNLGDVLDEARVRQQVDVNQARALWADEDADHEIREARCHGQAVDNGAGDRHEEQEGAGEHEVQVRFRQAVSSL